MTSIFIRRKSLFLLILVTLLLSATWSAGLASHGPEHILVTTTEDGTNSDGECTLREAIISANKNNDSTGDCVSGSEGTPDLILIPDGFYVLDKSDNGREDSGATGDLDITDSVIFQPVNLTDSDTPTDIVVITAIDGFRDRIFHIHGGDVTIEGITISGGAPRGDGGAILNLGTLTVRESTLTDNQAGGDGGALYNSGDLGVFNSTISTNESNGNGGGLFSAGGTAELFNVTVARNLADADSKQGGTGGGLFVDGGLVFLWNTILGDNTRDSDPDDNWPSDCSGSLQSSAYNLVEADNGECPDLSPNDNVLGRDPLLEDLQNNGGPTETHALKTESPAIDAGDDDGTCLSTDQRGESRVNKGLRCDIGAYEANQPFAGNDTYSTDEDTVLNVDGSSLPGVLENDNVGDGSSLTAVLVDPPTNDFFVAFELYADGTFTFDPAPNFNGNARFTYVANDGIADSNVATVTIQVDPVNDAPIANDDAATTNEDTPLSIDVAANDSDVDGNLAPTTINTDCLDCSKPGKGSLAINGDGKFDYSPSSDINGTDTFVYEICDTDGDCDTAKVTVTIVPVNDPFIAPVLIEIIGVADTTAGTTLINGLSPGFPNSEFTLKIYTSESPCDETIADGLPHATITNVETDKDGYFTETLITEKNIAIGDFVAAILISENLDESEVSLCVVANIGNISWPEAMPLNLPLSVPVQQFIDSEGASRWYKFAVEPDSEITVTLTNLAANYDLTIFTDILAAYQSITLGDEGDELDELLHLSAEVAPNAFSPNAFSPNAFSPNAFSPNAFSPNAFSPDTFSPNAFSPNAFSPNAFSPNAFSPDALSPDAFSPNAFSPNAFSHDDFSPNAFSPNAFSPNAFSSAQTRSLFGVSSFDGTSPEGLKFHTWNSSGNFYLRVRGRNGAFNTNSPFSLNVSMAPGGCERVLAHESGLDPTSLPGSTIPVDVKTLILADSSRMESGVLNPGSPLDIKINELLGKLNDLGLGGILVDVGADARVADANALADDFGQGYDNRACPYAKNLVADAIKAVVDRYWAANPLLQYIVILGGDDVIPFFRYPDQSGLGNESNFYPPVKDDSASQASLRLGYVLSQDAYGASVNVSIKDHVIPVAEIPVGRLVEEPSDMITVIQAYLDSNNGVVSPQSSLVTGYDFLEDAATEVQRLLSNGLLDPGKAESLITPKEVSPQGPPPGSSLSPPWTAGELAAAMLHVDPSNPDKRHDLIFLAGHFSANSALAADYSTQLLTTDLIDSERDFTNTIVYSAGCHSGYNIVNEHGIPFVTFEPDWAQAFAQKGATLIAGTGYQYGDTDFIEYSERLYVEFTRQLRIETPDETENRPTSVGEALVRAKQNYIAGTPQWRGIHEKAYLEATIFGLPMIKVDFENPLGGGETPPVPTKFKIIYDNGPATALGLEAYDMPLDFTGWDEWPKWERVNLAPPATQDAKYLVGGNGVMANPSEPVLPIGLYNVALPNTILRGIGFRGGSFEDWHDILPLTGAPATEVRGVHTPFLADAFYPVRPWSVNYFGALSETGGPIIFAVNPAQVISSEPGSETVTVRQYDDMEFRLFYSANTQAYTDPDPDIPQSVPAESDAPTISNVSSTVSSNPEGDTVNFQITVNGNPAAGVQEVWVTYYWVVGDADPQWRSKDLIQSQTDSTIWVGSIPVMEGNTASNMRFIVQAVNGVGMVSAATNQGAYYTPGPEGDPNTDTALSLLITPPLSGVYGTNQTYRASLKAGELDLDDQLVFFGLGPVVRRASNPESGVYEATLPLLAIPGTYEVKVTYGGTDVYKPSFASEDITIHKQTTQIVDLPGQIIANDGAPVTATVTLEDAAEGGINERTIIFVVWEGTTPISASAVITDYAGRAQFFEDSLLPGDYTLTAHFGGTITVPSEPPGSSVTIVVPEDVLYVSSSAGPIDLIVNQSPVAVDDSYLANQGGMLVELIGVLANDLDADGDSLTATLVAGPTRGQLTLNANGSFWYTPDTAATGTDEFTYQAVDEHDAISNIATVTIDINAAPVCSSVEPDVLFLWSPSGKMEDVKLEGAFDPDGPIPQITITGVYQDEPLTKQFDAQLDRKHSNAVSLRSDRDGNRNGRVYHIFYIATDSNGASCDYDLDDAINNGENPNSVRVPVAHDNSSIDAIDDIKTEAYDSIQ